MIRFFLRYLQKLALSKDWWIVYCHHTIFILNDFESYITFLFFLLTVCLDKFDEFLQRRITFCPDKENRIDVTEPKDAVGCFKVTKHFAFKFSHKQAGKVDSHRSTHFCSINLITYLETNERVLRYILKQVK